MHCVLKNSSVLNENERCVLEECDAAAEDTEREGQVEGVESNGLEGVLAGNVEEKPWLLLLLRWLPWCCSVCVSSVDSVSSVSSGCEC
jgi:hypothetical protein